MTISHVKRSLLNHASLAWKLIATTVVFVSFGTLVMAMLESDSGASISGIANKGTMLAGWLVPIFVGFVSCVSVITIQEYKRRLVRSSSVKEHARTLVLDGLFRNDNRVAVLREILNEPGIHYSRLLKRCFLAPGQLQWHLQVLLDFGAIKRKEIGQYVVFFPAMKGQDVATDVDLLLAKSGTSFRVFDSIHSTPGIHAAEIARILDLKRSSIKHHVDKLVDMGLIIVKRLEGRQALYVNPSRTG
nr:winged helix-turn-helix transcriptional regulator [Candidatus Sigynarchaeum springense]